MGHWYTYIRDLPSRTYFKKKVPLEYFSNLVNCEIIKLYSRQSLVFFVFSVSKVELSSEVVSRLSSSIVWINFVVFTHARYCNIFLKQAEDSIAFLNSRKCALFIRKFTLFKRLIILARLFISKLYASSEAFKRKLGSILFYF